MYLIEENGIVIIHFYYPIEKLRDEVEMKTSYLGRFRKTESAAHLLDMLHMSKDEADLFNSYLKTGMSLIFGRIGKYTKNLHNAYRFEPELADTVSPYEDSVHYTIEWGDGYNQNYIEPLNQHIFDTLVWYIIWRWLMLVGQFPDDIKYAEQMYKDSLGDVGKDAHHMVGTIIDKIPRVF